ncbi:tudor domain-containing protein 5 isoform X1 [Hemitrygon akajei]|uniref:tudor domain-containing protein 5 isoform X1 n=1 Tax=Hemitrygon akajei TaxID=2704970 RepID=UPI003BF9A57E
MSDQQELLEIIKKEVRSLLISSKNNLTLADLEKDYQTMMGKHLPWSDLGYKSALEFVLSMPDTIKIHTGANNIILLKGVSNEATKGIEELVTKAKVSNKTKTNFRIIRPKHELKQYFLPRRYNTTPVLPALVKCELRELVASFPQGVLLSDFDRFFLKKYGKPFQYTQYGFFSLHEVLKTISEDVKVKQTRQGSLLLLRDKNKGSPLKQGKQSNQSIQTSEYQTKAITVQPDPSKTPTSKPALPLSKLENTPGTAPDPEYFERDMKKVEEDLRTVIIDKGVGGTMDSKIKEKILFTVAQRPNGLLASRLPMEYKNIFGVDLPLKELGFYSVTELVAALNDIFHVERDSINQDWLVFDIRHSRALQHLEKSQFKKTSALMHGGWKKHFEENMEPQKNSDINTISLEMLTETYCSSESEIPPDAVQDGILYKLPELEENTFACVFVECVTSPSQFFIRFYGELTSVMLEDLMIEMRRCYSYEEVSERYVMPDSFIQPGQLCCVRNGDDLWWYRVIIHKVLDEKQVEVYYVDFGDISLVERSRLRFLKHCYSKLPAQGIPSTLIWLQPVEGDWSTAAKNQFLKFCGKQPLVALIYGYINDVLHLFLCDTSTDEDVYINDVLKKSGHAEPCLTNNMNEGFGRFNPVTKYLKNMPSKMEPTTISFESKSGSSPAEEYPKKLDISIKRKNMQQDLCSESLNSVDCLQNSEAGVKSQDDVYFSIIDSRPEQSSADVPNAQPDETSKLGEAQLCANTSNKKAFGYICETPQKESVKTATGSCLLFNDVPRKSALISPVFSGQREFHLAVSSSSAALGPSARMAGALHHLTWLPAKHKSLQSPEPEK